MEKMAGFILPFSFFYYCISSHPASTSARDAGTPFSTRDIAATMAHIICLLVISSTASGLIPLHLLGVFIPEPGV